MANESNNKDDTVIDASAPQAPERERSPHSIKAYSDVKNGDAALNILLETGDLQQPSDPQRRRRLIRRIDLHVMPLICMVYFLQYIDKTAISYASVTGMRESANLVGNQFNWVASIFFFGQLAWEFPTIRLLQMFPLAKYVSINVTLWGVFLSCMAAGKSYGSLLGLRFLLGMAEAAVVPAWVVFTSQWYKKEEQPFRVGVWFSMCGFAQLLGGCFAYGVATHVGGDVHAALKGWQVIFLVLGLLTVLVGIAFWFVLPDSPATAWFLSAQEKAEHIERLRGNEQGIGSQIFKWEQFWEALRDPLTWLYAFWVFAANIPNSIATSFGNILVTGMGYSRTDSLLLVTPLGAYEIVVLIGVTYLAMRTQQRLWCCILTHIPSIVGAILMATTDKAPALVGYYLSGGIPIGWTTILGLQASNVAGSTKKITVTTIGTIAYTIGNIISPQTFQAKDAPRYLPAKIAICIIYFLCTVDLYLIRMVYVHRNKKREAEKSQRAPDFVVEKNHEFKDRTDVENQEFRYSL